MERIPDSCYSELIEEAYSAIPDNIVKLVRHVHFFCGVDPVFAGLVKEIPFHDGAHSTHDCMCYESAISVDWKISKSLIHPTIFIPFFDLDEFGVQDVVHELGHALDDVTPFFCYQQQIKPVTDYAKTDYFEAFAEAFASWLFWGYGEQPDEETIYYFEKLRKGEIN
jgi:hypothetical protein